MSRGRVDQPRSVIRDPASAIAASKCWMARWRKGAGARMVGIPTTAFHPEECGFCEYPPDDLIAAVTEFRDWAGLNPTSFSGEAQGLNEQVEMFLTLHPEDQKQLVQKRQGYWPEDDDM